MDQLFWAAKLNIFLDKHHANNIFRFIIDGYYILVAKP